MQFDKNREDRFRILQLPSTASRRRRRALTLRPILFRRRRRRRRDKRKKMTGRAKRKPKSSQVNLHCFHYLGWAAGTSSFAMLHRASGCDVCGYNGWRGNLGWTLWAEVFGTLSEQRWSDDNMAAAAAALMTGTAKPLVHWRTQLSCDSHPFLTCYLDVVLRYTNHRRSVLDITVTFSQITVCKLTLT